MSTAKHFAVLIGVDFYIRKPLKSCVRDIELVEGYLRERKFDLDLTKLTASTPTTQESDRSSPIESGESLATIENVKKSLRRMISQSTPGDYIYVHFSGHGTVLPDGQLALVLYGCEDAGNGWLRDCLSGRELAELLNEAVTKGVKVLLVLDCCFSGKMTRRRPPDAVRYLPSVPLSATRSVGSQPPQAYDDFFRSDVTFRGASTCANWILDPKGYTILTACAPTQETHGLNTGDGMLYGAFTLVLIWTLRKLGSLNMSHMAIYQFICATFRAMESPQVPQLKGAGDFSFFGHLQSPDDSVFPVSQLSSGAIIVQAGEIMGVHENDKLVLSPLGVFGNKIWREKHRLATARNVGGVTARVELDDCNSGLIGRVWVARLLKFCEGSVNASEDTNGKRLGSPADGFKEHSLPVQKEVLLPPGFQKDTAPFHATINDQGRFEVRDSEGQLVDFDAISFLQAHSPGSRAQIVHVLAYLTRYHDIVRMNCSKENEKVRNAINVRLCNKLGAPLSDAEAINVDNEQVLELLITNHGEQPLFANIFLLGGDWEITNMLEAQNTLLPPVHQVTGEDNQGIELKFIMEIPEQSAARGINSCENILKVFVTTKPVPLGNLAAVRPLLRGSPAEREDDLPDSWVARTFHIRTTKRPATSPSI